MKTLVVGFPRSGTTKMCRLIDAHPMNDHLFIEKFVILDEDRNKQWLYNNSKHNGKPFHWMRDSWCEKIVYESEYHPHFHVRRSQMTPMDYCDEFTDWFKHEAKIIHILRHPIDAWNSLKKLRSGQGHRFENIPNEIKEYIDYVPTIVEELAKRPNILTVKFEDVISKPMIASKLIYEFCEYKWTPDLVFKKLKTDRVFAYKNNKWKHDPNYQFKPVIKAMNKIQGSQYE